MTVDLVKGRATGRGIGTERLRSVENARGSNDEDTFGNKAANHFIGVIGEDDLDGGAGRDILEGWGGRSELRGDGGDDHLFPGVSDIVVHGGTGVDTINVSTFTYALYDPEYPCGASPAMGWTIDLNSGRARNANDDGFDFEGIENVIGSDENDRITGDAGDNRLRGLCGNDILEGRGGHDSAVGDEGQDVCAAEEKEGCES